jgi:small subunit ribosomal protein S9
MVKGALKSGRRKTAVARVNVVKGKGMLRINNEDFESYVNNSLLQLKVKEPIILAEAEGKYDISVNVNGGGQSSQIDAIRQAIARALVEITGNEELKKNS